MTYNCIQGEIRSIQCNKYNQTGVNIKETDDGWMYTSIYISGQKQIKYNDDAELWHKDKSKNSDTYLWHLN